MEEKGISLKAAKRKRQRSRKKEKKLLANCPNEPEVTTSEMETKQEKSKEQILAERKAKKAAKKQGNKSEQKQPQPEPSPSPTETVQQPQVAALQTPVVKEQVQLEQPKEAEKSRDQVLAEREAKKLAKQAAKKKTDDGDANKIDKPKQPQAVAVKKQDSDIELATKLEKLHITEEKSADDQKKKVNEESDKVGAEEKVDAKNKTPATKAERRALQEAQRAAKAKLQEEKLAKMKAASGLKPGAEKKPKQHDSEKSTALTTASVSATISQKSSSLHKVRLFKHLYTEKCDLNIKMNSKLHPAIIKLGTQYAYNSVVGCNSRCYAFLNAMQILVKNFVTPQEKEFSRALETEIQKSVEFLHKCRPLAVSVINALKYIKMIVSQENSSDNDDLKKDRIMDKIETYAHEQIETAAKSISLKVREKISDDDVILTFGCSSLIKRSLIETWKCGEKKFSVVVVDSRPDHEGQEMLKSLAMEGINCTYVLINAISFIMPKVSKVLLGAHALLANGYVMSRVGTAQIAMVANFYNVPVLVCCETHKFSERVQTDSFVYNEIGDPNALVINKNSMKEYEQLKNWEQTPHLTPLNLRYDITPPELVTVVVTEVALLPCTSVQVILRVKPTE